MNQLRTILNQNVSFWKTIVPHAWNNLSFDKKLSWLVFIFYTIALLTIIELFLLK